LGRLVGSSALAPFFPPYRKSVRQFVLLGLLGDAASLGRPLVYMALIDRLMRTVSPSSVVALCGVLVVIALAEALFSLARDHYAAKTNAFWSMDYQFEGWRSIVARPLDTGPSLPSVEVVERLGTAPTLTAGRVSYLTAALVHAPVALAMIVLLTVISWPLALVYALTLPVMLVVARLVRDRRDKTIATGFDANARYRAEAAEIVAGQETILALGGQTFAFARIWRNVSNVAATSYHSTRYNGLLGFSTNLGQNLITIGLLLTAALLVLAGSLTLGQLVAFEMISTQLRGKLRILIMLSEGLTKTRIGEGRLPAISGTVWSERVDRPTSAMPRTLRISIDTFQYPGRETPVLRNVNVMLAPGERLRIGGESGSGKSTLGKIIAGLIDVPGAVSVVQTGEAGRVPNVLYIPQDPFVFAGSVAENVLLKDQADVSDEDEARAEDAVRKACLTPDELPARLAESGRNLSGGQRQRLHLARAFLTQPDLLILDEPTRGLDEATARALLHNMSAAHRGATIVFISHDPLVDQFTDRMLTLEAGQVGQRLAA
jgi:ABC-type bacteriocin/lantibiotic exporter with double-glycine peptidase domain